MNNDKEYGVYLGIVVQNNDPEMRGRVKIYIPQLAPNITKLNENVDKFFNFMDSDKNPTMIQVLEDLKAILPWSEFAGPIMGGNASGRFNATTGTGTTSDSNAWDGINMVEGFRPAQNFVGLLAYNDAFNESEGNKNQFVNQHSYQYTPSNYSGMARGLFSIPNVGAHVYTFFINGDRNFPVYFASAYSQDDVKRIFTMTQLSTDDVSTDYPKSYENVPKSILDSDSKTFRSKTVLNSNKNTIELVDTDLKELIKFTHYSGSFKEFNNYANIELATNNDQKLVIGDQFSTVKRNKSDYTKGHNELIVGGDHYINIGESKIETVREIVNIYKQFHEYKMLFDMRRVAYGGKYYTGNPNNLSPKQKKQPSPLAGSFKRSSKGHVKCPVCKGKPYNPYDPSYGIVEDMWLPASTFAGLCMNLDLGASVSMSSPDAEDWWMNFFSGGTAKPHNPKVVSMGEGTINILFLPPEYVYSPRGPGGPHPHTGKIGYYRGDKCSVCNGTGEIGAPTATIDVGYSPSSELGMFMPETDKLAGGALDQKIMELSPQLFNLENQLGKGGDEIVNISMSKIETIGLVMNDMMSFKVDPIGKLKIDGCTVAPQGTYDSFKPSPHVEYADVDDIPGGDYILTAMNKYKLLVGAKGINIQTFGPIDIYGTIVNFAGEQLNISSKNEILIDGGERLSLRGRKISLLPVEQNAVVVEGQLHVTKNSIFEGGMMIEGELALLHITAPLEWQVTEIGVYDLMGENCTPILGQINGMTAIISLPNHTHYFKNLPLTLTDYPEMVREQMVAKGINSRTKIAAATRTANPETCSSNLIAAVRDDFEPYAENAVRKAVSKVGSTYVNGCYTYKTSTCQSAPISEGTKIIDITLTYYWLIGDNSGYVRIKGKVTEHGTLIGEPETV